MRVGPLHTSVGRRLVQAGSLRPSLMRVSRHARVPSTRTPQDRPPGQLAEKRTDACWSGPTLGGGSPTPWKPQQWMLPSVRIPQMLINVTPNADHPCGHRPVGAQYRVVAGRIACLERWPSPRRGPRSRRRHLSHPCCVLLGVDPLRIDRRAQGLQLRLGDGQRVRVQASHRVQTEGVTVGSAISLFSGAGGLDLGIESAGFAILAAVEWDDDACDTMEKNAPSHFPSLREVVRADLYPLATGAGEGLTTRDILRAAGLSSRESPDLLVGGPPCVAFSKSGFWLDWKRDGVDPAASLLQAYVCLPKRGPGISSSRTCTR